MLTNFSWKEDNYGLYIRLFLTFFNKSVTIKTLPSILMNPKIFINIKGAIIFVIALILLKKYKIHPIVLIVLSALVGILLFYAV